MSEFQQSAVSSVIWLWQKPSANPKRGLSREVLIQVAVMWCVAALFYFFLSRKMAAVVVGVSLFVLVTGCWVPAVYGAFRRGLLIFGVWVGTLLTWILMVPFFYGAFSTARLILLLKGHDPLNRAFPAPEGSLWIAHKPRRSLKQYERLF